MPVNSDNYNNDAILGAQIEQLVQKVLQKYVEGSNVIAEMGNNFDARLKAVEDALKLSNVGAFVADSVETQSLKVGGEDVTDASNHTATFSQASSRTNITTGEKLSAMFSKIAKWLADLKTVAFTGSYNDLSNKPNIPSSPVQSDWNESGSSSLAYIKNKPGLATVATSGSYNDLSNKPTIPASKTTTNVFIGYSVDTSSAVSKITVNSYEFLNGREFHLFFSLKSSIELSSYTKDAVKLRFYIGGLNYQNSPWKMTSVIQVVNGVAKLNTSILPFNWKGEGIMPEIYEIANYLQIDFVDVDNDSVVYMTSGQFINVVIRGTESY